MVFFGLGSQYQNSPQTAAETVHSRGAERFGHQQSLQAFSGYRISSNLLPPVHWFIADVDIFTCDDVTKDLLKARKEFEYLLQPAEERVALKLKKQLMSVNANTRQASTESELDLQLL